MTLSTNYATLTYDTNDGFLIELKYDFMCDHWEAWIRHKDYGVMDLMFGVSGKFEVSEILEMVEEELPEWKENYAIDRMGA